MPVEIKELIIRATVDDAIRKKDCSKSADCVNSPIDSDYIITECVRKVMDLMHQQNRR